MTIPTEPFAQLPHVDHPTGHSHDLESGIDQPLSGQREKEPLAIVGIGCRFPGATNLQAFWKLLCEGRDAITDFPTGPGRFDIETFYDPQPATPGKMVTRQGGFLSDIDRFDCSFFGISPREASYFDPQIRALLEIAWEALEDAGEVPEAIAGSQTGVFIGAISNDYLDQQLRHLPSVCLYSLSGTSRCMVAGRISFTLDLRGPSFTMDTACSSSLVAFHLACQSIWSGESSMALAGGVNLCLEPGFSIGFSQAGMLSPESRCKAFDATADGFVRSEGAGIVLLKPLSQARAEKNQIYAVVCGSAISNDGQSGPFLLTPSSAGQEIAVRNAYQSAGKDPAHVQYVEAHGTGTQAGDPVEIAALTAVLGKGRTPEEVCYLGSVKANIGHTEAAAGIAGIIKTALCLKHRTLVPNLHFHTPNPAIEWASTPLRVVKQLMPWPQSSRPALASVCATGITGTNVHVVLEEADVVGQEPRSVSTFAPEGRGEGEQAPSQVQVLPLSAKTEAALLPMAENWQRWLSQGDENGSTLPDLCATAAVRRMHHEYRLAVVGASKEDMVKQLDAFCKGENVTTLLSGQCRPDTVYKVVFVFPGQGSQWIGMGYRLLAQEAVFRTTLEQCDEAMRPYTDWSLLEQLTASETRSRLDEIACVQPMLFALEVALARLWISWGIYPDAVVGHSMGEVAAAHIAGVLSLSEAARIICVRSHLLQPLSGQGAMAVVGLSLEQTRQAIAGKEAAVSVAVSNSPTSTVLSGDPLVLRELLTTFEEQEIFCRSIKVDVAGHSPQMDPLLGELEAYLHGIKPQKASLPFYSTVTTKVIDGPECDETYWVHNLREPVLFASVIQQVLADGATVFLEVSPHPLLPGPLQQCISYWDGASPHQPILTLPSLRRDEDERTVLLSTVGALYTAGYPLAWQQISPLTRCVTLPNYPWQREHCWSDPAGENTHSWGRTDTSRVRQDGKPAHPLLQHYLHLASSPRTHIWETYLHPQTFSYLNDHCVQGSIVLPAAAYMEMVCAAAQEAFSVETPSLTQFRFERVLFLSEDSPQLLQVVLSRRNADTALAQFFTLAGAESEEAVLHASAIIHLQPPKQEDQIEVREQAEAPHLQQFDLATLAKRCTRSVTKSEHYQAMEQRAIHYGPSFQGVEQVWQGSRETLARVCISSQIKRERANYILHPAILDACLQAAGSALATEHPTETYLPVGVNFFSFTQFPGEEFWVYAQQDQSTDAKETNELMATLFLLNDVGEICAQVKGLSVQRIGSGAFGTSDAREERASERFYELAWELYSTEMEEVKPLPYTFEAPDQHVEGSKSLPYTSAPWLIFADESGVGEDLQAALEEAGEPCILVFAGTDFQRRSPTNYQLAATAPQDFVRLLQEIAEHQEGARTQERDTPLPYKLRGILHLWSLDTPESSFLSDRGLQYVLELACSSVLHLVQALAQGEPTRLFLLTRGAQAVDEHDQLLSSTQAAIWGLGRVVATEHPELRCTLIDLSPEQTTGEIAELCQELKVQQRQEQEEQIALRGTQHYRARLKSIKSEGVSLREKLWQNAEVDTSFRLEVDIPGMLESLTLRTCPRIEPAQGEVEIQVEAAGINFRDIMQAMGINIGKSMGLVVGVEYAGFICRVGPGVTEFRVGDAVVALFPAGFRFGEDFESIPAGFRSFATVPTTSVIHKPEGLSFEEVVTLPLAFSTAWYALYHLGRLEPGERILIHSACGAVGQAAIQMARLAGAEIFATAGTEEKRAYLRAQGIQHVMDSHSLTFVEDVLAATQGQGVDLVLNSLAGEALRESIKLLRPYGRFLEIGKRDIYEDSQIGLLALENNLSFFAIAIDRSITEHRPTSEDPERPTLVKKLLKQVMQLYVEGQIQPLPLTTFSINDALQAFRLISSGQHKGKVVFTMRDQPARVEVSPEQYPLFKRDATYLITGGHGGLGLVTAEFMVNHGANHLVLVGRNQPKEEAQQIIEDLRQQGAEVMMAQTDISKCEQIDTLLKHVNKTMPPLRGVIHAAAVLDDGTLLTLDQQRFWTVLSPKVLGAWHLHQHTQGYPLDLFVCFSSAAALLGSPGQGNYCAANAFLDTLMHERRRLGLPALSINWGAWAQVGLAAAQANRGERIAVRGIASFSPEEGLRALEHLLQQERPQVAYMAFDLHQWQQFYPQAKHLALFAHLETKQAETRGPTSHTSLRYQLQQANDDECLALLESAVTGCVAKILGYAQTKINQDMTLHRLGLDSLMALEVRNTLARELDVTLPLSNFLGGNSLRQVIQRLYKVLR